LVRSPRKPSGATSMIRLCLATRKPVDMVIVAIK
jgi:hypothetical protein